MLFKKKITKEIRLEKYWDDHEAKEYYRLVKYWWENGKFKGVWMVLAIGDKDWANRQSKHYGLSITTPIDEED